MPTLGLIKGCHPQLYILALSTSRVFSGNPDVLGCAPPFEKMSYDNSQLARVYLHAWILTSERSQAVTGNDFFRTIIEQILDYVVRKMTYVGAGANDHQFRRAPKLPSNTCGVAIYSTQDADSEGKGGKFIAMATGCSRRSP